jgi:hypothetical protein
LPVRLSAEGRVLLGPAAAFAELAQDDESGGWVLVRRPLLLAFVLGCTVSLLASRRMSARLIADGAVSFAFVPLFELAALAAVYWRGSHRISFARAADLFFAANAPWLLWLLGIAALGCVLTPVELQAWMVPPRLWFALGPLVPLIAGSAYLDFSFFREALQEPVGRAVRGVILQRAIAWPCAIAYYVGHEIWELIVQGLGA